jgi:type IV pilus assembly protein PilQ
MSNVVLNNRLNRPGRGLPNVASGQIGKGILTPALPDRLNVNLPATNPAGSFGLAILGADYLLDLELSAAQTEGRGEVISSPRVITANQQEADIKQGQEVGYVTFQNSGGGAGTGTATVQFKEAVLELKVTPTITADDRVVLNLNVKKDAIAGYIDNPGGGQVPTLDKREISTEVLVDNGQTVVLGGVYEVSKSDTIRKVPLLGDVPLLGNLFKNKARNDTKAELLIFVTPRILSDSLK